MKFVLVDRFLSLDENSAVAVKNVTAAEEYLADHFPRFPVLPGVFMVEALTQAARAVLEKRGIRRMVLGEVKALRYGSFVRPGESLRVEVKLEKKMTSAPRKVGEIVLDFDWQGLDQRLTSEQMEQLKEAGLNCPVYLSLSPEVKKTLHW